MKKKYVHLGRTRSNVKDLTPQVCSFSIHFMCKLCVVSQQNKNELQPIFYNHLVYILLKAIVNLVHGHFRVVFDGFQCVTSYESLHDFGIVLKLI